MAERTGQEERRGSSGRGTRYRQRTPEKKRQVFRPDGQTRQKEGSGRRRPDDRQGMKGAHWRILFCELALAAGLALAIHSMYNTQIVNGDSYRQKALSNQLRTTTINAGRGAIYDRNMNKLAVSATVWTVLFSPADIDDREAALLADKCAAVLDVDAAYIMEKAKNKKNYYQVIKRQVEKDKADEIIAFARENKIIGVTLEEDSKRFYPFGSLASNVLGFVNAENRGAYGLEARYDSFLSGIPGRVVSAKNARGKDMPFRYQSEYAAQEGNNVILTLDDTVQQVMEKNLRTAVIEHGVRNRATGIFMNVKNGEILGMVTMPDFDPNNPFEVQSSSAQEALDAAKNAGNLEEYNKLLQNAQFVQWNNKCISESYEPGSVFKIITLAAALEAGVVNENNHFNCPGYYMVGKVKKSCWKTYGHGMQNLTEATENSCNPAFMMIGQKLGAHQFYQFFDGFGLTAPTGIDLPGEGMSVFHSEKALANPLDYENSLTSCSFGQTFQITPIQLITAVSAAVNGGYLYEPYVVKRIVDNQGNLVAEHQPVLRRQVISNETSERVCRILESVVENGSGRNAYIPGYRIGGKTGTSEKILKSYSEGGDMNYILSFVGIAPMDDPQYACLVMLDEPTVSNAYGSTIAAPIVGSIFAETLPYLGLEKVFTEEELEKQEITVGTYTGEEVHLAKADLTKRGLNGKIMGDGGKVVHQVPEGGSKVPRNASVILYTDSESAKERVVVPDVRGKSGLTANQMMINAGLNIKVTGVTLDNRNAVAARQSIAAGTEVPRGTVVTVDFADSSMASIY